MRIVMDFDGVFTDPTLEGEACFRLFRNQLLSLKLLEVGLETVEKMDSWLSELRVRQAMSPFLFGWRSEGRVSAFSFEDPFLRNIGLADYLDHLVKEKDPKAIFILKKLRDREKISTFEGLSEWAFRNLTLKKRVDSPAKKWVESAIEQGHEVTIVSNSPPEKIESFLEQNEFKKEKCPKVRGGAKKFGLGSRPNLLLIEGSPEAGIVIGVDTDRPFYEAALMEIRPDMVIGDVFCFDLSLPVRLKREGRLDFKGGIFYRHRDYTPTKMIDLIVGQKSKVPEVKMIREWSELQLN